MLGARTIRGELSGSETIRRLRMELDRQPSIAQKRAMAGTVETGWPAIDEMLPEGGLSRGAVHEWIGTSSSDSDSRRDGWRPPLSVLVHLTNRAHASARLLAHCPPTRIAWIGASIWPYPIALCARSDERDSPLRQSIFIRAARDADRLWAAELVLRSRAAAVIVLDGSGFSLTATRRVQLAAEAATSLCLLARPPWEADCTSAAWTRWLVRGVPSPDRSQRWLVELLRCKGFQPACAKTAAFWRLERRHATRDVSLVADLGDGCCSPPAGTGEFRAG